MDPLTITATAIGIAAKVGSLIHDVQQFMKNVRDARTEMDFISQELGSLKFALELLAEDAKSPNVVIPPAILNILKNCEEVITRLDESLKMYNQERIVMRVKYVWSGSQTVGSSRNSLATHRDALNLAIDLMTVSLIRETKNTVEEVRDKGEEIKADTERILSEIERLQNMLPQDIQTPNGRSAIKLRSWLEELTEYAPTVIDTQNLWSDSEEADEAEPEVTIRDKAVIEDTLVIRDTAVDQFAPEPTSSKMVAKAPARTVSFTTPINLEFEKIGLESTYHKEWREKIVRKMNKVVDKCEPINGRAYERDVDYTYGLGRRGGRRSVRRRNDEDGKYFKWVRTVTMSGDLVNAWFYRTSFLIEYTFRAVSLAVELRDMEWLESLLRAGAEVNIVSKMGHQYRERSVLGAALDWDVGTARLLRQAGARPGNKMSELAGLPFYWTGQAYHLPPEKAESYLRYVAQFLLEADLKPNRSLNAALYSVVSNRNIPFTRFFTDRGADIFCSSNSNNFCNAFFMAIKHMDWVIVRIFVNEYGADCHKKSTTTLLWKNHRTRKEWKKPSTRLESFKAEVNAIEFAFYHGILVSLNRALGTQYGEPQSLPFSPDWDRVPKAPSKTKSFIGGLLGSGSRSTP